MTSARTAGPDSEGRLTAAGRLLTVLDAFDPDHRRLSLSDIARRSGLSLSTVHRLVHELAGWGALERDEDGHYSVGLRLLELSALAPRGLELREAAFPHLDDLHRVTRGNVHLAVRDGTAVVYVEAIRARERSPVTSRVGDRWPMHATGTGLVLLAHAAPSFQERVLGAPLVRFTRFTTVDPTELRRVLAGIRQTGVVVARGTITPDDTVVAVPVADTAGRVAAAISVVVEAEQAPTRELAGVLKQASRAISRTLGPRRQGRDGTLRQ